MHFLGVIIFISLSCWKGCIASDFKLPLTILKTRLTAVREKLIPENMPLFELSKDLEEIVTEIECENCENTDDMVEAEKIFSDYLDMMRDFYFSNFEKSANHISNIDEIAVIKDRVIKECSIAMSSSKPRSPLCDTWQIDVSQCTLHGTGFHHEILGPPRRIRRRHNRLLLRIGIAYRGEILCYLALFEISAV